MYKSKILLILTLLLIAFAANAHAFVYIDFEGVPLDYYYKFGNQNLGSYYPGLYFSPDVTILDADPAKGGYNWQVHPYKSPTAVYFAYGGPAYITFDNPVTYFEGWFTHMNGYGLTIYALDSLDNVVDSDHVGWDPSSTNLLSLSAPSIKKVFIDGYPNCWTGDDIMFDGNGGVVPEPATMVLVGVGIFGLIRFRRKK